MWRHRGYSLRLAVTIGIVWGVMSGLTSPQAATFKIPAGDVDSLIAVINTANGNGEDDTIKLAAGTYTLTEVDNDTDGPNGLPSIISTIAIQGADDGSTIINRNEGAPQFRIFHVAVTGALTLNHVTVEKGHTIYDGGGINNQGGVVQINYSAISHNRVSGHDTGGGGIYNQDGILQINYSAVSDNEVSGEDDMDAAGSGAGISNQGGALRLNHSTVNGNVVPEGGTGGISNGNGGAMFITNSTISGNGSGYGTGGLSNGGTAYIFSSTITDNNASSEGREGGIENDGAMMVSHSIIAGNLRFDMEVVGPLPSDCGGFVDIISLGHNISGDCPSNGPGDQHFGDLGEDLGAILDAIRLGPLQNNGGPTQTHALLVGSPAIDAGEAVCTDADGNPLLTDQRGILRPIDSDDDGAATCDIGAYEREPTPPSCHLTNADFRPTLSMDFTARDESLAMIDVREATNAMVDIPSFSIETSDAVTVTVTQADPNQPFAVILGVSDQGGNTTLCGASPVTRTVTTTADVIDPNDGVLSLREALAEAQPVDTIDFDANLSGGAIVLTLGQLTIDQTLLLEGPGATQLSIDGNEAGRVFEIADGAFVSIAGLSITGGKATGFQEGNASVSGGIFISNGGALTLTSSDIHTNSTEGIITDGNLTLINTIVRDNSAEFETGGIAVSYRGELTLIGSTVRNNQGTGISGGTATIQNSTISGNQGAGISGVDGAIHTSTISGNQGAGISGATMTIQNSTISGNQGGGISSGGRGGISVSLTHTIVAGNYLDDGSAVDCEEIEFLSSLANNLVGADTGCASDSSGDMTVDPAEVFTHVLGPLQNNGGPTETHALLMGSPAIDAGDTACVDDDGAPLTTDQRGLPRPVDGNSDGVAACDIGAFELQMEAPPVPTSPCAVVTTDGEVTGFEANGQEVKLPKELHKRIDWAVTQSEYQLSLYTWYGSTTPFAEAQGRLDLESDTQVKKVKCEAISAPEPSSPCEIVTADGDVMGFPANGQEVKLPKELHKSIDWATTQAEYQLSLYTWYGSTTPFAEAQGRLDLEPDTQVKKVKCKAISAPEPSSPCEIVTADGEVMGFPANGQEVKLPKELHKRIDWATTQDEYQLSLYTWYGSTTPFAEAQGRLDLEPDTQVKKVKCEAL